MGPRHVYQALLGEYGRRGLGVTSGITCKQLTRELPSRGCLNIVYTEPRPEHGLPESRSLGTQASDASRQGGLSSPPERSPGRCPHQAVGWLLRRSLPRWQYVPSWDVRRSSCTGHSTPCQGCWVLAVVSSDFSVAQGQARQTHSRPVCVSL